MTTFSPACAAATATCTLIVVLPAPPFWLITAMVLMHSPDCGQRRNHAIPQPLLSYSIVACSHARGVQAMGVSLGFETRERARPVELAFFF